MSWVDSFSKKLLDGALGAAGFGKSKSNYVGVEKPSEVNPVRVIYGRPGWIETTPVIVENYRRSARRVDLSLHYIISEGIQRVPDAIILNEWLYAFSQKYKEPNKELQNKTLGLIADKAAGTWENGYKIGDDYTGNVTYDYNTGWPDGIRITRYNYDPYNDKNDKERIEDQMCGLSSLWFRVDIRGDALNYITAGTVPRISVLPNGQYLHDPRITNPANDYLRYISNDRKGRTELGGFAKGWRSQNLGTEFVFSGFESNGLGDTPDNNPALVVLDYMTHDIYGAAIKTADINLGSFVAAANYSDELSPTYQGGAGQPQFACDIELSAGEKLRDNLDKILFTCRGGIAWIDGQYHLKIRRASEASVFSITNSHIIRRTGLTFGKRKDRLNRIIATYTDSGMRYKERQLVYPPPQSQQFTDWMAEDGQLLEKEMRFQGVNNVYRAADLAHTLIKESRAGTQVEYECTLELLKVTVGDKVRVTDDKFDNKLFYVSKVVVSFKSRSIRLTLKEQDESAYDTLLHPSDIQEEGGVIAPDNTIITPPDSASFVPDPTSNYEKSGILYWQSPYWPKPLTYSIAIYKSGQADPVNVGVSRFTSYAVPYLAPGQYIAEIRAVSGNLESRALQFTLTLDTSTMPLPPITGLSLVAGGDEFHEAAMLRVDPVAAEPAWLEGFEWKVYSGSILLRTEITKNSNYTYTLAQNLADGGNRALRISVRRKAVNGEYGQGAEITISHPAPAAPSGLEYYVGSTMFYARWRSDATCRAYLYTTQGIVPDDSLKVYEGRDNTFSLLDLDDSSEYFFIIESFDVFGAGGSTSEIKIQTAVDPVPGIKNQLDRIDGIQLDLIDLQEAESQRLDALYLASGLDEINWLEQVGTIQDTQKLAVISQSVMAAAREASSASFRSIKDVMVTKTSALAIEINQQQVSLNDLTANITDYQRTAIGYCVDADGNPTNDTDATLCGINGHTWITAPLSEAITKLAIELPDGKKASAGTILQVLSDDTEDLKARAALQIDVNGRLSGIYLEGSETASALDIVADSFRLRTNNGSLMPFEVVGNKVFMKDVEIGAGTKITDGLVTTGGLLLTENGYVRAGKTSFASTAAGLWLGMDNSVGKLHIGNSSNHLKWDGSTLDIAGVLSAVTFSGDERWVKSPYNNTLGRASAYQYEQNQWADGGTPSSAYYLGWFTLPASNEGNKADNKITYAKGFLEVSGMLSFKNSGWTMQYQRVISNGTQAAWINLPNAPEIIMTWPENEVRIFPMTFSFPLFVGQGGVCQPTDREIHFRLVRTQNVNNPRLNSVRITFKYDNM